ncbi:MAG: hypothetical protein ACR2RF_01965 [Geminicoccaceae bacterium]
MKPANVIFPDRAICRALDADIVALISNRTSRQGLAFKPIAPDDLRPVPRAYFGP